MNHDMARTIFEEIRARPYQVSEKTGECSNNCYFKGRELLQRLGTLGYMVRGRVGETYWDKDIIPERIIALYPPQFLVTHFYVETEVDGKWRVLDPSIDPKLEQIGFRVGQWQENSVPCFNITKLYTHEETIAYQQQWSDSAYSADYFAKAGEFLKQLNIWLDSVRSSRAT